MKFIRKNYILSSHSTSQIQCSSISTLFKESFFFLSCKCLFVDIYQKRVNQHLPSCGKDPMFLVYPQIIWIHQFTLINNLLGNFNKVPRACSYVKVWMSNLDRSHWWYSTGNQEGIAATAYLKTNRETQHLVQSWTSFSHVWLFTTPWTAARQASLSITISRSSLKLTSIESVRPSSHLILCRPLLLLPPINPSIRGFSSESTLRMRWPKYWSFSFSISPSNEHPGLISFRMD